MSKLAKLPADDLFENSSMSFGEHLEELRKALVKAFLWLGIGTCIGLLFANQIVQYIQSPLQLAISDFYIQQAKDQFKRANGVEPSEKLAAWMQTQGMTPERVFIDPQSLTFDDSQPAPAGTETAANNESNSASGSEDWVESRPNENTESDSKDDDAGGEPKTTDEGPQQDSGKVAAESAVSAIPNSFSNPWKGIDLEKLERLRPLLLWRPVPNKLVTLNAIEGFMIWLKAGLVAGVVIGSPGIFWHIWQFFAAGLYPHERRYVYWYLPLSLSLFLAGVFLAFFVVFRLVLGFLMTYTTGLDVEFTPRLNDYMSFALFLPLGFGIAFQLPIGMLGLHRFGIVSANSFLSQWRLAVLVIAFLSMLLTPADVYSMLGLFIPMVGLYFFGILLCQYMPQGPGVGAPAVDPKS